MITFDSERLEEKKKKIQGFLWSMDQERYPDQKVLEIFNNNLDSWVNNAIALRNERPAEIGVFFAKNYLSSFYYRFVNDELSLAKKRKRYTRVEKIKIIKDSFEKAYHHFGLLAIASNYSSSFMSTLYDQWYYPSKASECFKDDPSCWKDEKGTAIAGRAWAISNLPFLECFDFDPKVFRSIRVADSHSKLIYEQNRIVILKKNGKVDYILPDRKLNYIYC